MKIFKTESAARDSLNRKEKRYINSLCPYSDNGKMCGSWCALFYFSKESDKTSPHIILGCKSGTDRKLYLG